MGQPRAGKGTGLQVGSPGALPHPCPHHLCDCGQVTPRTGPGSLVKNEGASCRERDEPSPRSPEVLRRNTTLACRKIYFLGICLFGCRQWGSLPAGRAPRAHPSAAAVCLTALLGGLAGCGWVPAASCPFASASASPYGHSPRGGGDEIRTSIITHDSGLDRILRATWANCHLVLWALLEAPPPSEAHSLLLTPLRKWTLF